MNNDNSRQFKVLLVLELLGLIGLGALLRVFRIPIPPDRPPLETTSCVERSE